MRKFYLPLLAFIGILFTVCMIVIGSKESPVAPIVYAPPASPYTHFIAAVGLIESIYKNIPIGIALTDIVDQIHVHVGQIVKRDTPLFTLDTRSLVAQLEQAEQGLAYARINYENTKLQFSFYERLTDKSAASEQAYTQSLYQMKLAQQQVENAQAYLHAIQVNIERSTARAPIDGEILQLNIRTGQLVGPGAQPEPFMVFGDTTYYHVRIDVDEEDAWRFVPGASAQAFVRGNASISVPLEYVYTEPYIIPKKSLSGVDTERVDTRVLQVVYRFERDSYPLYAGLLLDVYIQALPNREPVCG